MESPLELVSFVARAENRVAVLLTLAGSPASRRALQDETEIPRATLSRILADCRDRDLVRRDGHRYETTPLGNLLAVELESLLDAVDAMGTLQTVRKWLSIDEHDIPIERLADADVVLPEPTDPMAPVRRAEELLAEGSNVRILAHSMVPSCLAVVWKAVTADQQTLSWVTTAGALDTVMADPQMASQTTDLLASEQAAGFVHPADELPLVVIVDDVVFIAVADDTGTIRGHVETTDAEFRGWAERTVDRYVSAAEPIEPGVLTE